jgi:toxin-antitoxin system PIN domain toxin
MKCVDVNVLVFAHRVESPHHERHRAWLEAARTGIEPLGVADVVLSGFLRVVTHRRIFREPTPIDVAMTFVDGLLRSPAVMRLVPGDGHWSVFTELCRRVEAAGNTVPDAYLAALAIEAGGTLVSADRGFARFPGLRWSHPLDA